MWSTEMTWMVHKLHVVKPWRSTSFVHRRCNKLVTTAWTRPVRGYIHRAPCGCPWLGVLKGCWNRCFPPNGDTHRGYKFQDYGINFLKCVGIQCFILNYLSCLLEGENKVTSPNAVASYWTILWVFWAENTMTFPMQRATLIPPGCRHFFGRLATMAEATTHLTNHQFDPLQQFISPSPGEINFLIQE